MNNFLSKFIFIIIILTGISGCKSEIKRTNKKQLVVSILPLKYFAEQIAGKNFEVSVLVPPGSSAENFEPTPREMTDLSKCNMYITTGNFGFDNVLMEKISALNPKLKIIDVSKGIQLINSTNNIHNEKTFINVADPHIWLSPQMAKIIARNIFAGLSSKFPLLKSTFYLNYQNLISDIDSLDKTIKKSLLQYKNRKFIIYHPALAYFARDYGLEQFSMEVDGKEPTPQNLSNLIDLAKKENIHVVFIQKEFDIKMAKAFAQEINGKIIEINVLSPNWLVNMKYITQSLIKSFNSQ